jgi:hypothetical protein
MPFEFQLTLNRCRPQTSSRPYVHGQLGFSEGMNRGRYPCNDLVLV